MGKFLSDPRYILDGDMSDDVVGPWRNIQGLKTIGFQAVWTGDPTGEWFCEVSNDGPLGMTSEPDDRLGPTELTLPTEMTEANPAGAAGDFYFEFSVAAHWIRFGYEATSGAGELNVGAHGKDL